MRKFGNVILMDWPVKLPSTMFTGLLMVNHPPVEAAASFGWGEAPVRDDDILKRVCDYFDERVKREEIKSDSVIWGSITSTHTEFVKLIQERDYEKLHEYMSLMFTRNVTSGTAQGDFYYKKLVENKDDIQKNAGFTIYDKFITLMEAIGLIPAFSPEEYQKNDDFLKYFTVKPDNYINFLEESFKCKLDAPKYQGGLFGMKTNNHGLYSDRDIMCLGIAIRIYESYHHRKNISICNIGGGVGYLEYYLIKMGFTNLTMIDLPTVSTTAKYFIETNLPENKDDINLISPLDFTGEHDLVVNFDGLTTYGKESAQNYVDKIADNAKHFLSINREHDDFRVCDICPMVRVSRNPFWYRKGYIEENYFPEKK